MDQRPMNGRVPGTQAGATTNSDAGVTDVKKCMPALEAMAELGLVLEVHGEVTHGSVDMFDREKVFLEEVLGEAARS